MNRSYSYHPRVENAFLVRERDRRRRRELGLILLAAVPLGLGLLTYSWVHQELVRAGYALEALEERLDESRQMERQLRLEAAYLANPSRIETRAAEELGMAPPVHEQMLFLEPAAREGAP